VVCKRICKRGSWSSRLARVSVGRCAPVLARFVRDHAGGQGPADDQLSERVRHLPVSFEVSLNVLLHLEGHVRMPDPPAQRLPVDLRVPPAVA
jgi:hypothetical protein